MSTGFVAYTEPSPAGIRPLCLVSEAGTADEQRYVFYDRIEIGRFRDGVDQRAGLLLIRDPTISRLHCVLTQRPDGRCFVRDLSRNGTWLDRVRLTPNVEVLARIGQIITVGSDRNLLLTSGCESGPTPSSETDRSITLRRSEDRMVTVLVGDIQNYTSAVSQTGSVRLQQSVNAVFDTLERAVGSWGGTVKEHQGDAVFAFWEHRPDTNQAVTACHAAIALEWQVRDMARDRDVWDVPDFPLRMDWALATGRVAIATFGADVPIGLSMVGEPVVLAFRMEKLAGTETGSIVACSDTARLASPEFEFRDLGPRPIKGFETPRHLFALVVPRGRA